MLAISAIGGAGTMVVELAAVRLLAPWFGTSLVVWTNVIAVILLALALGYLLGGVLAARAAPLAILCRVLLAAGALVTWLPLLGAAAARGLLPERVALHEAAGLVGWGSLAVSLLVFLPPAALLGMVCPLVVEELARERGLSPGRAGGLVLFVSTAGSLVGVFGTSHLLLPRLGLQLTFLLAGSVLLAAGVLTWLRARRAGSPAVVAAVIAAVASSLVPPPRPSLAPDVVELESRESPYQSLRVVEHRSGTTPLRWLQVNEGFDSFQSVWQPQPGLLPAGYYYNDFLLPLLWSETTAPWRVLVLGFGAGTIVRVFEGESGVEARFLGVELDPGVIELGRRYFGLDTGDERLEIQGALDARVALHATSGSFEQIVLDCYSNQVEIPAHLCTVEFFREVRGRLSDRGWLTANLGGFDFDDPVVAAVARTCATAFDSPAMLVRIPLSRNYMLLARRDGPLPWTGEALAAPTRAASLPLGARRLPGFTRVVDPGTPGQILTDDRCPVESLQLRSIAGAQARRLAGNRS